MKARAPSAVVSTPVGGELFEAGAGAGPRPRPGYDAGPVPAAGTTEKSLRVRHRWTRRVTFWLSLGWLVGLVLAAIGAGFIGLGSPTQVFAGPPFSGPSVSHLLGTDDLGRDMLSRLIYGSRVSLVVGAASISVGVLIGGVAGLIAGYRRGWTFHVTNAVATVVLAFPPLIFLISAVTFFGHKLLTITLAIGFLTTPAIYRVVRAETSARADRE